VSPPSDAVPVEIDRFRSGFQRRGGVQGAVRPVLVMVGFVLAQDLAQVGVVPDEGSVQELAPASADPAFGYRVHPGARTLHSTVRIPASARTAPNAAV